MTLEHVHQREQISAAKTNLQIEQINRLIRPGAGMHAEYGTAGVGNVESTKTRHGLFELTEQVWLPTDAGAAAHIPPGLESIPDVPWTNNAREVWVDTRANTYDLTDLGPDTTIFFPTAIGADAELAALFEIGDRLIAWYMEQRARWETMICGPCETSSTSSSSSEGGPQSSSSGECEYTGVIRIGDGILFRVGDYVYERSYLLTVVDGKICSHEYDYTSEVYICCEGESSSSSGDTLDCICCDGPRPDTLWLYFDGTISNNNCAQCANWMYKWWECVYSQEDPDTCIWECVDPTEPCNGHVNIEINCPCDSSGCQAIIEIHVFENGVQVAQWQQYVDTDDGKIDCTYFGGFGAMQPSVGHPDECDWTGVRPLVNIAPVWPI